MSTPDQARLDALRELAILDTPPEPIFDEVAQLAAQLCEAPVAQITLVDDRRQWNKAVVGADFKEVEIKHSFCAWAQGERELFIVPDLTHDDRFAANPYVQGAPHLRSYAGAPLYSVEGTFLGTLSVLDYTARDLTASQRTSLRVLGHHVSTILQQRALVARLERERTRLADAQAVARVGSWETDLTTLAVSWSAQSHVIFGTDPTTFTPNHPGFLDLVHPDDRTAVDMAFVASVSAPGEHVIEHRIVRPDGRERQVEERWRVYFDADGKPSRAVGTCQDITERRRLEQQMFRAQRLESIGTLAGGVAHDLNNVLAPILLSIEMLAMDERDAAKREILATIESSARRGAEMVKQVLTFARGAEGAHIPVPIPSIVASVGRLVTDTFGKHIQLRTEVAPDLPELIGDPTQVEQVLLNLCVNARDAMPHGGELRIRATTVILDTQFVGSTPDAKTGPHVVLDVEDTGTGMTPELIARIFDPFFTTKEPGRGTGLGLSSSIAIVKSHGGFIHVYSEPGKGSRFRVYLPAGEVLAGTRPVRRTPIPPDSLRGHGELVLVVEDEEPVRVVTQRTLESFGYTVLTATDGADAIAQYAQHRARIALVLTDVMMPIMDGGSMIEVLARMDPTVRVVAVSGLQDNGHLLRGPVKQFLAKPFTAQMLLEALRRALTT